MSKRSQAPRRSGRKRKSNNVYDDDFAAVDDFGNPIEVASRKRGRVEVKFHESRPLCQRVLTQLMEHPYGPPFNQPVDPVKLMLPDYFDKIRHPMDFGTIQKKLDADEYTDSGDFAADVRLVFKNCWTYNLPGSPIHLYATTLSGLFESSFKEVKSRESEISEGHELGKMQSVINDLRAEHMKLLSELQKLVKDTRAAGSNAAPVAPATAPPRVANGNGNGRAPAPKKVKKPKVKKPKIESFGYQQKVSLNEKISKLSADNLQKMVEVINAEVETPENGELEIDLEKLSVMTLKKLDAFVNTSLKQQNGFAKEDSSSSSSDSDSSSDSSSDSDSGSDKDGKATSQSGKPLLESEPSNEEE